MYKTQNNNQDQSIYIKSQNMLINLSQISGLKCWQTRICLQKAHSELEYQELYYKNCPSKLLHRNNKKKNTVENTIKKYYKNVSIISAMIQKRSVVTLRRPIDQYFLFVLISLYLFINPKQNIKFLIWFLMKLTSAVTISQQHLINTCLGKYPGILAASC